MFNNAHDWKALTQQINVAKHLCTHMVINHTIICKSKLIGKKYYVLGMPGGLCQLCVLLLTSAQVMMSQLWDWAPPGDLCWAWSLLEILSLPLPAPLPCSLPLKKQKQWQQNKNQNCVLNSRKQHTNHHVPM